MRRILVCLPVIVILLSIDAIGQVSQSAVPFLLIAPGARAGGMGESFMAVADDATAVHWNPAGLGRYPLSSDWIEMRAGQDQQIQKIALVKNDMPDINYRQYDIWAIINNHLAKWDNGNWTTQTTQNLVEGQTIQSAVLRYTGLAEEQVAPFIEQVVGLNNDFPKIKIDTLQQAVAALMPADYQYSQEITDGFKRLQDAWNDLKVKSEEFYKFERSVQKALEDGQLSSLELDGIAFGFDVLIAKNQSRKIAIPYDLVLKSPVNSLESQAEMLYVGTDNGFYRFDPKRNRWKSYGREDTLQALTVTALAKYRLKSVIIGTDRGVVYFDGASINSYPPEAEAPTGYISSVTAADERTVWAGTENDLYVYDGTRWQNYLMHEVTVGETLDNIVSETYRAVALINKDELVSQIMALNNITGELQTGQQIKLPYRPALKGQVLSLAGNGNVLWIGTGNGVVMFNGESFFHFGYKEYQATQEIAVAEIARQFLPDANDEDKINRLATIIRQYNGLDSDTVKAGQTVLVFANSLGAPIPTVASPSVNRAYVSTIHGVVEFNEGEWSRFPRTELARTPAHTIKTEIGEMWFATSDAVYILSKAFRQITFMHVNWLSQLTSSAGLDDMYFEYFSFVYPTNEWGTFGLGVNFLSMGEMQHTGETGEILGTFNSYEFAVSASYGARFLKNLAGGLSLKYIRSNLSGGIGAGAELGEGVGFSFAIDGGILYDINRRLTFASTISNIGPDISYIDADQADPLPRQIGAGIAYKIVDSPFNRLTLVADGYKFLLDLNDDLKTEIKEIRPHIGLEYWYSNYVALRSGYVHDEIGDLRYFTVGASLQWTNYRFDLSYVPDYDPGASGDDINSSPTTANTMRFSMNVSF